MNGLWDKAAERLRGSLGQVSYETWIGPLTFLGMEDRTATIEAPNRFFRDWVNDRYLEILRASIAAELGEPVEIKLTLGKESVMSPTANGKTQNQKAAAAAPAAEDESVRCETHPQLNSRYTFPEFVVGSSNQFAHAAAVAVANQPGEKYN